VKLLCLCAGLLWLLWLTDVLTLESELAVSATVGREQHI